MDSLAAAFDRVILGMAGQFLAWDNRTHVVYIAAAFVLYLAIVVARRKGSLGEALGRCFDGAIWRHRSAVLDYKCFLVNNVLFTLVFAYLVLSPAFVSETLAEALRGLFGARAVAGVDSLAVRLSYTLAMLLAWDFGKFFAHYLKHRIPLLWEFHKVHHSAEVLTPITALRLHPVEWLPMGVSIALTTGAVTGAFTYLLDSPPGLVTVVGVNAGAFLWYLLGYNLRHTHLWISYGPRWSHVFISPAQHQIHHSRDPRHYDSNFGYVFAFWDKLFGTLYVPKEREELSFGIAESETAELSSLWGLYAVPMKRAGRLLTRGGAWQSPRVARLSGD